MSAPWDGAPGWPRPRLVPLAGRAVPACFVQSDPTDPLSVDAGRLRGCHADLACQVCGLPALLPAHGGAAWVLSPAANMGGATCTRCTYLAVRTCPHLAAVPDGSHELWQVRSPRDYRWHVVDGTTKGHVVPVEATAQRTTWAQFLDLHRRWKRGAVSARAAARM